MALTAFYCALSVACVGVLIWFYQFCMDCKKTQTRKGGMLADNSFSSLFVPDHGRASSHVSSDLQPCFCCAEPAEVGDLHILEVFVAYGLFCIAVIVFVASALALAATSRCDADSYGCQTAHVFIDTVRKVDDAFEARYDKFVHLRQSTADAFAENAGTGNLTRIPPDHEITRKSPPHGVIASTVGSELAQRVQTLVYSLPLVIAMSNSESHVMALAFAGCANVFNTLFIPFVRDTISHAASDPAVFYNKVEQESLRWWEFVYDTASVTVDHSTQVLDNIQEYVQLVMPRIDIVLSEGWTTTVDM